MAVAIQQNRQVRGARALAERPDGIRVPFAPYPTPLRDPAGALTGAINMLTRVAGAGQDGEDAQRKEAATRCLAQETERWASNLLLSVLPIANMLQKDGAHDEHHPSGRARALAFMLLEESCLGPALPSGRRASSGSGWAGRV